VDLFHLVSWCLVVSIAAAFCWPVNLLFLALALKVRDGVRPIDMETNELWWRSAFASLGLAILSAIFVGLNYVLVPLVELPQGPIQTILLVGYVGAAITFIWWSFALESLFKGTAVFLLYVFLLGLPLLAAGRMLSLWQAVKQDAPWFLAEG